MVISHVAVEEIVVVPADHSRVRPNTAEATPDMARSNGVKGTSDIQKSSKAVRAGIDVAFYVVRKSGGGGLRGFVAAEAVLLRMNWGKADTLLHMPRAEPFQSFEEVVREGDGAV